MKRNLVLRGLVTQSLETISREIFRSHSDIITKLIGKSAGVYALYDDNELYYVGRATQLRTRVKQHLTDRHIAGWTHFSLYLIKKDDHIGEIESLLIRIAHPRGNSVKPKGKDSRILRKQLKQLIKIKHKQELGELLAKPVKNSSFEVDSRSLKGIVKRRTPLYRTYKGKEYKSILTPAGLIIYKGVKYNTPTAAAKKIVDRITVNGWSFWHIRNQFREWVKLKDYK
jgi:hypothetical protein